MVLDGLEHGDRATELQALLGVLGGEVGALAGDADRLGGEDRAGEVDQRPAGTGQHVTGGAVQRDPARPAGGVEVGRRLDRHAVRRRVDDDDIVTDGDEDDVGQPGPEHGGGGSVQRPVAQFDVAAEGDRAEGRPVGQAGQQPGPHLVGAGVDEHGAGDQRGHERTGGEGPTELFDDDHDLLQAEARAPERLGHVQSEPAQVGGIGVEGGVRLVGAVEQCSGGGPGLVLLEEVGHRAGESQVVFSDRDRHQPCISARARPSRSGPHRLDNCLCASRWGVSVAFVLEQPFQ